MKTLAALVLIAVVCAIPTKAQQRAEDIEYALRQHQTTILPATARFEIIQAAYSAKATFMLDRYQGTVWQAVEGKTGSSWERIEIEPHKFNKLATTEPTFALFISKLGLKFVMLINTQSGAVWNLVEAKDKSLSFRVMPSD